MKHYLEQLLYSLNETEIEQLKPLRSGNSKISSYLSLLIENREEGILDKEFIQKKYEINAGALRKMRAVLLNKCLQVLAPKGGKQLLNFLSTHRLREMFIRESDAMIPVVKKKKTLSKIEKEAIYFESVMGYLRLPCSLFEETKMDEYLGEFLAVHDHSDKQVISGIIKLNEIFVLIAKSYYRLETFEQTYRRFHKMIKTVKDETARFKNPRLTALTELLFLVLDFYYKANHDELQPALDNLKKIYSEFKDTDTRDEYFAVMFYRAYNQMLIGNFNKAKSLFDEMEELMPENFPKSPNIVYRYVVVSLVTDRQNARRLLDTYLEKDVIAYDTDAIVLSSVGNAMYYLLENELDKSSKYIDLFWETADRKEFFIFEYIIRIAEIAYFYQSGDDKFALSLTRRFKRYIDDKSKRMGILNVSERMKNFALAFEKLLKGKMHPEEFEDELSRIFRSGNNIIQLIFINALHIRKKSTG